MTTTTPNPGTSPAHGPGRQVSSSTARRRIAAPTLAMLPRIGDSLSFLYADVVRIVQDDTGVCAETTSADGDISRVYLPTSLVSCLLLGPGTSITQPALTTFARHGTTVVCTGSGGVRCYSATTPDSLTTRWLERQVHQWSDLERRLAVAQQMYLMRFTTKVPATTPLNKLRGLEGQRMKALYKLLAQQHGIGRFRRAYDPAAWDDQDRSTWPSPRQTPAFTVTLTGLQRKGDVPERGAQRP